MFEIITALSQTSLPGILAFAGLVFIFFAIGGKLGAQIGTDNIKKRYSGIIGGFLLLISLTMFAVSATIQIQERHDTQEKSSTGHATTSTETFRLRPILPTNQPILQLTELEWRYTSSDNATKCTFLNRKEYIFTIIGRDSDGEASVAKRKSVADVYTETCSVAGKEDPQTTETHGELEGKELLARKTADGFWVFDDFPGSTEKQQYEMGIQGFLEPFSEFPKEKVPIGKVMLFKDQDVSLALGTAFPGKTEGSVAIKFIRVLKEREPVAQLSVSMDVSMTTLTEENEEIVMEMSLNGGGRLWLSDKKILSKGTLTGIIKVGMPNSKDVVAGPATMKLTVKELQN